jgi:hypothetical protein
VFWFGQIISAIGSLIGLEPIRNWIRLYWSKIDNRHFNLIRGIIIIIGFIISGTLYIRATNKISHLELRTQYRSLNPTQKLIAALNTDPRGRVHVIADSYDGGAAQEYLEQWTKLFTDTGWPTGGRLELAPLIPQGVVTLAIRNPSPHALHLRDVLVGSGLPISVVPSDAPFLQQFNDLPEDVLLFIGRRP